MHASEGASREAVSVTQLARTTRLLPDPQGALLRSDLDCYARAVVYDGWPQMAAGARASWSSWLARIEGTSDEVAVDSPRTEVALSHWLEQQAERREETVGRVWHNRACRARGRLAAADHRGRPDHQLSDGVRQPARSVVGADDHDRLRHAARGRRAARGRLPGSAVSTRQGVRRAIGDADHDPPDGARIRRRSDLPTTLRRSGSTDSA